MLPEWLDWLRTGFWLMFDASWRAVLVAAGVAAVLFVARARSGSVRHAAWTAVLGAMLLMPVLPLYVPSIAIPLWVDRSDTAIPVAVSFQAKDLREPGTAAEPTTYPQTDASRVSTVGHAPAARPALWPFAVLVLYASGTLLLLARFAAGWRAMRAIVRRCTAVVIPGDDVSDATIILESPVLATPVTVGIVRPCVLLPMAWRSWPRHKLRAVLAHELAHVRRRDALVAFVARVNVCIFWFHPLAWWLERALAADAEHACDDAGARAIGETRGYAEVLLDMAESVRRAGGRMAWQGVGVHGSGLLGQRIDRIMRGDFLRQVSMTRKLTVAVGSALAIFLAIACHQQRPAPPLTQDPKSAEESARREADSEFYRAARAMRAQQVVELQARWRRNPEDTSAMRQLLVFYSPGAVEAPGEKGKWVAPCTLVIPEKDCVNNRREVIAWLVEHHPDSAAAGEFGAFIFPTSLDLLPDPRGYEQVKKLWLDHASHPNASIAVLRNAAAFFRVADKPLAEQMLLRAQSIEPGRRSSGALGDLYALVIVGSNASMSVGVVRSVSLADAHGAYAEQVRKKLEQTSDADMLVAAGRSLVDRNGLVSGRLDFDPVALGRSYLERAVKIEPQHPNARASLVSLRARDRAMRLRELLKGVAPEKERERIATLPDAERFGYLPWLAERAFMRADYYKNSKHDEAAMKAAWQDARRYAEDLLSLAARFRDDPNYGTAVYSGNTVLGLVTYREGGDTQAAVRYAIEASKASPTEELRYGSPFELQRLLAYLVRAGERDKVAECLDRIASVSVLNGDHLRQAAADIRRGVMPEYWDRIN